MIPPIQQTEPMTDDIPHLTHPGASVGLPAGQRFKCDGCGNLTRFDVEVTERVRRYWHVALSGDGQVEESDVREQTIESVTCRWCGATDRVVTELSPAAAGDPPA